MKAQHPDYGIKRIWTSLKETKGIDVSEKRVRKCMQDNSLITGGVEAAGSRPAVADQAEFDAWCQRVLAESAHLVAGVAEPLALPPAFKNYQFTGKLRPAHVTSQARRPARCGGSRRTAKQLRP